MDDHPVLDGLDGIAPAKRKRGEGEATAKPKSEAKGVQFRRYRAADPYKCDMCVDAMVQGGKWKSPERATHEMRAAGQPVVYLCYAHAVEEATRVGARRPKRA